MLSNFIITIMHDSKEGRSRTAWKKAEVAQAGDQRLPFPGGWLQLPEQL